MEYVVVLKVRAEVNSEDEIERAITYALLLHGAIKEVLSVNATGVRP